MSTGFHSRGSTKRPYDPKTLDVERFDLHPSAPIAVSSFVERTEGELVVQARIRTHLLLCCGRCLETFESPLETSATFTYRAAPTDIVDITDDVRQELLLAFPMIPLCRPACKGLCRTCGQNLNQGRCAHQGANRV